VIAVAGLMIQKESQNVTMDLGFILVELVQPASAAVRKRGMMIIRLIKKSNPENEVPLKKPKTDATS